MNQPTQAELKQAKASVTTEQVINVADEIASSYYDMGWFSGNVLIAKEGDVIFSKSYGYKRLNEKNKNTIKTKFNLGSIMKNFTKTLVLQQIQAGKLSLDDTLERFELGFPEDIATKISVDHLLNHQSGFGDIFIAEYREDQLSFDTLDKKLQLLRDKPLLFEPGTDRKYSNFGYIVLGAILEKVSGSTFESLLIAIIFEPVNMQESDFKPDENDPEQSLRYTYLYNDSLQKVGITEYPSPDGGIEASVSDVQKFYRELFYGNKLLNRANPIVRKAFNMDGKHWAAYGGGLGVSAAIEVDLLNDVEIVVLANTDSLVAEYISGRIHSYINNGSYPEIKDRPINFAYKFYATEGKGTFFQDFKQHYADSGYTQFIGRPINELGMQLLKSGSREQAFDIFNYLVHLFPNAPQAYDSLAFAYHKIGKSEEAKKSFLNALKLKSDFQSDYISDNYGVR